MSLDFETISTCFRIVLARPATAEEAETYQGMSRFQVLDALYADARYPEQSLPIARLYTAILGREPEPEGLIETSVIHDITTA